MAPLAAALSAVVIVLALGASSASAAFVKTGEFSTNALAFGGGFDAQSGVAVDSATGNVFAAYWFSSTFTPPNEFPDPGAIEKFDAAGALGTPARFGANFFRGVAVDPVTHNVYGYDSGTHQITTFDPGTGDVVGTPFAVDPYSGEYGDAPQLATDALGNVYYPNQTDDTVEKFSPAGVLLQTFDDGAGLFNPRSVAVDAAGDVYVVDAGQGKVFKFGADGDLIDPQFIAPDGSPYTSVDVNRTTDEIFVVKDLGGGHQIEVSRYDAAGNELETFGENVIPDHEPGGAGRLAVNSTTGVVYVSVPSSRFEPKPLILIFKFFAPPTATTGPVTNITRSKATVHAQVNPNGNPIVACQIQYGPATFYGYSAPCTPNPGAGTDPVDISAHLTDLKPSTKYHVRVRTSTAGGTTNGSDQTFTTLPSPPSVTTGPASFVTPSSAILTGTVNAHGDAADCVFEYGPTAAYGRTIGCSVDPVTGAADTVVTAALADLTVGATYHYRVRASNAGGTGAGTDATFRTPGPACVADGSSCRKPPPTCATDRALCAPNPTAYKTCLKKATRSFRKAMRNAETKSLRKAAVKRKRKAVKQCKARFLPGRGVRG
ncbi:MAG TPA: hypothetical protein VD761_10205 [Solirubrobacterales bacterium]|nr:hypothetical protein [Solirubrobacterales bacterium]